MINIRMKSDVILLSDVQAGVREISNHFFSVV